jgi:alanine racemase
MRQALISKSALLNNIAFIKSKSKAAKIMAYVKANAYGHGLEIVSSAIEPYVDGVTVSDIDSVYLLKKLKFKKKIVLTSSLLTKELCAIMIQYKVDLVVYDLYQINILKSLEPVSGRLNIWLKINTGMNRLGIDIKDADAAIKQLSALNYIQEIILMTHCANAEDVDHPLTIKQIKHFNAIIQNYNLKSCFANTAGVVNIGRMNLDWVRLGIGLYGALPNKQKGLIPILQIQGQVLTIQNLLPKDLVGYGSCWQATTQTKIAIVSFGYADGIPANIHTTQWHVEINDKLCPVVGKISMDLCAVEIGNDLNVIVGDRVNFFSKNYDIHELSKVTGRSNYELLTQLGLRLNRVLAD